MGRRVFILSEAGSQWQFICLSVPLKTAGPNFLARLPSTQFNPRLRSHDIKVTDVQVHAYTTLITYTIGLLHGSLKEISLQT